MWLNDQTQGYEVALGELATTELSWVVAVNTLNNQPDSHNGSTNGTAPVLMVQGLPMNVATVFHLSIHNDDNIAHTVIVQLNDNGTRQVIISKLISPGSTLVFNKHTGWGVS